VEDDPMNRIIYSKYSNERSARFQIRTDIIEDESGKKYVRKSACTSEAKEHISNIEGFSRKLDESYKGTRLVSNKCVLENGAAVFEFLEGRTFEHILDEYLKNEDYTEIVRKIQEFFDVLKSTLDLKPFAQSEQFQNVYGDVEFPQALLAADLNNIDYIFGNIFMDGDKWTVIDYEWTFDFPIPYLYIVYRAIHYYTYDSSRTAIKELGILRLMGINEQLEECFELMEHRFQLYILGEITPVINMYDDIAGDAHSFSTLISKASEDNARCEMRVYYDRGNGFSEEDSEVIMPENIGENANQLHYSIEVRNAKALRLDPVEKMCILSDIKAITKGEYIHMPKGKHNGFEIADSSVLFTTDDPMIVFDDIVPNTTSLEFFLVKQVLESDASFGLTKLVDEYKNLQEKNQELSKTNENLQNITGALNSRVSVLANQVNNLNEQYQAIANSTSIKVTKPMRFVMRGTKKVLKSNKFTYKLCRGLKCLKENGVSYTYNRTKQKISNKMNPQTSTWEVNSKELADQRRAVFNKNVKFSIIVPLYNTPLVYLKEMIESVQQQTYPNWELCLADGSDEQHLDVSATVANYMKKDARIKYRRLEKNEGISENTNRCLEMATGNYIALFDHDDLLHPSALYENMRVIESQDADFIYSDENTFSKSPKDAYCPHFKPDFSPDTLRSYNYICHFSVFKKTLLDEVGWFRKEFDGSQDYDIILRLTEKAKKIVHIPKIIYYWRAHPASVASNISAKTYCLDAAKAALNEHLVRVGLKGKALDASIPSVYRMKYEIIGEPLISIIIPNKDYIEDLSKCVDSIINKSTYRNFEIIIVENNSELESTFEYYKEIDKNPYVKVVYWKDEFNYSAINNFGFKYAKGEYILLLNNDMEVITPDWLQEMLMFAQRKDVGAVGAKLYYPDDTIQHAGIIVGIGGVAGHSHKNFAKDAYGYSSRLQLAQNLSAVTAACMLMARDVFEEVGGLDEGFKVAFNDVDLCMKIREKGYLIVFTPFAELYHYESKSRGYENTPEKVERFNSEIQRFYSKWDPVLEAGDPYYNPNLTLRTEDFAIKPANEGRIRA